MIKMIATLVLSSTALCGAGAQSLRSQIEAADRTTARLMMAKDVKGLTKHWKAGMTADFKYVEAGKTQNFDAMAAGMAMGLGQMGRLTKAETKLLALREKGDTATATSRHTMVGTMVGGDKKPHTMTFTGTSTDSYVRQGGKWKMSRMAWTEQKALLDGKPMGGM